MIIRYSNIQQCSSIFHLYFSSFQKLCLASIFITTFIFTITWQFSPFILLLQAIALFYLGTIAILDRNAVSLFIQNLLPGYKCLYNTKIRSPMYLTTYILLDMQDLSSQLNGCFVRVVFPVLPIFHHQLVVRIICSSSNHFAANTIQFYPKGKFRNHEKFDVFIFASRIHDIHCLSTKHGFQGIFHTIKNLFVEMAN